jgi:hypothetical protein
MPTQKPRMLFGLIALGFLICLAVACNNSGDTKVSNDSTTVKPDTTMAPMDTTKMMDTTMKMDTAKTKPVHEGN